MTEQVAALLIIMLIPSFSLWKIWEDYKKSQQKEDPVKEFIAINNTRFSGLAGAMFWPMLFIMYIAHIITSVIHPNKIIPEAPEEIILLSIVWALYYPPCIGLYASCLKKLEKEHPSESGEIVKKDIRRILRRDFLFFSFFLVLWYFTVSSKGWTP